MSETYKDRQVRCYFGILNLKGLMDTDNRVIGDVEAYGQVRLPLFSHETYKIKTTFNKNLVYEDTYMTTINMQGEPIIINRPTSHYGMLHFADDSNPYEGKYYQKKFRSQVLWDFGDGTKIEGYSAEHAYKKPGRYKITCTFFDINRQAWVNNYHIFVVVKQVIPTLLRFPNPSVDKTQIFCSKIQKIAELEALVSNTIDKDLQVNVQRLFSDEEHKTNYQEITKKFDNIPQGPFRFMHRSWLFLENTQMLYYNSDKIYMNSVKPSDVFHPNYQNLYGKFYYDEVNNKIEFSFYQVIPYKNIDEKLKTITILDPNARIIPQKKYDDEGKEITPTTEFYIEEQYKTYRITQLYIEESMPQGCIYVGKRGFFDIFYKNDFVGGDDHENVISIFYEIEKENITGELESAPNYLNINPLGLNIKIINNNIDDVKIGLSTDCFIRQVQESDDYTNPRKDIIVDQETGVKYNERVYIDPNFYNSLIKGIDIDNFVFPYISYGNSGYVVDGTQLQVEGDTNDWTPYNNAYYIPKDVLLRLTQTRIMHNGYGNNSMVNMGAQIDEDGNVIIGGVQFDEDGNVIDYTQGDKAITEVFDWLYRIPLILRDYIDIVYKINYTISGNTLVTQSRIKKLPILDTTGVIIPRQRHYFTDIDRLLDVYMSHPMFMETQNVRDMFKAYLSNGFLDTIMTRSKNFLDDMANIRTCYLSNLISMLKMMGQDVTEFEKNAFEGINDLKSFVRLLSMNHGDLVGHVILEDLDIRVNNDVRGKNVSALIGISDTLYLNNNVDSDYLGKIIGLKRNGAQEITHISLDSSELTQNGLDIIIHDRYTHQTRVVSFMQMQKKRLGRNEIAAPDIRIQDYEEDWGWNLLLPDRFANARKKQKEYAIKMVDGNYSPNRRHFFAQEYARMQQICRDMIDGYYDFYVLDPRRSQKRVGNFMDDLYITERIEKLNSWEQVWGITHEILMKILFESGNLFNGRDFSYEDQPIPEEDDDQEEYVTTGDIYLTREYDQGEIIYDLQVNDERNNTMPVSGSVKLFGTFIGQGRNTLNISIDNCLVDREFTFTNDILDSVFEINVNYDGTLTQTTRKYNILGDNIQGYVRITLSGSVENPNMLVDSFIDFTDKRIQEVEIPIIYHRKTQFYTNLRSDRDKQITIPTDPSDVTDANLNWFDMTKEGNLVDNTNDDQPNKVFEAVIRWDDVPKIGNNKIYLDVDFDTGNLYYREGGAVSQASAEWGNDVSLPNYPFRLHDIECNVVIEPDGSILFGIMNDNGIVHSKYPIIVDISDRGDGINPIFGIKQYVSGKLYFVISGNVMATQNDKKPRMDCYSYNPENVTQDVATRLMIDVGGYSFNVTEKSLEGDESYFRVNGADGFDQGYSFIVVSQGYSAHSPYIDRKVDIQQFIYIFHTDTTKAVKTIASPARTLKSSASQTGVIEHESFTNTYSQGDEGSEIEVATTYISTTSGWYQLDGYDIDVNI